MADPAKIYERLPLPLKIVAANVRGLQLRRWRYGRETPRLVHEARERESWSADRWTAWIEERRAYVLERAARSVPHYREMWSRRRARGDRSAVDELGNWPLLTKEQVRSDPDAFLAEDRDARQMFTLRTSGTTGTPVAVRASRSTLRGLYALFEARLRGWHGVAVTDRWAILGGQVIIPFKRERPPFWIHNRASDQLYLSQHHISPPNAVHYARALRRFRPTHLIAYPSSAAVLAGHILEQGLDVPSLKVFFSNAEPLTEQWSEAIGRAFGCPVRNTYGQAEAVAHACECVLSSMHVWPEVGSIQVLDDDGDEPVAEGDPGRFVVTSLLNADNPLIRYEVGDRGVLGGACSCGRALPVMTRVEGRSNELIVTRDGRRIFWLGPSFNGLPIKEAQIVQESVDRLRILIAPARGFDGGTESIVRDRLSKRVGEMDVVIEKVDAVPRGPGGKFRAVISRIGS